MEWGGGDEREERDKWEGEAEGGNSATLWCRLPDVDVDKDSTCGVVERVAGLVAEGVDAGDMCIVCMVDGDVLDMGAGGNGGFVALMADAVEMCGFPVPIPTPIMFMSAESILPIPQSILFFPIPARALLSSSHDVQ